MPDPSTSDNPAAPVPKPLPRVLVLLATFNGLPFLPEQLTGILAQRAVDVRILVSDDGSTDGTVDYLDRQVAADPRVRLLGAPAVPVPANSAAGAAGNFYRLLRAMDPTELAATDLVALADQDDIWAPDKLANQARQITEGGHDGVSASVTAFDDAGKRWLVKKDYPQRQFDYLLESPGPGCTFVVTPRLVTLVREALLDPGSAASSMQFHDWLIYGMCRARGWSWLIDGEISVEYRQHANNSFGANRGLSSKLSRLGLIGQRWHRGEAIKMARVAEQVSTGAADSVSASVITEMLHLLDGRGLRTRWKLVARAGGLRRRPRDRVLVGGLIGIGMW